MKTDATKQRAWRERSARKYAAKVAARGRSPIAATSKKKRAAIADRTRVRAALIAERGDVCELRLAPDCQRTAEGLHEPLKQGASPWRPGDYERGRRVFLACNRCNQWVEDHPAATPARFRESRHADERRRRDGA